MSCEIKSLIPIKRGFSAAGFGFTFGSSSSEQGHEGDLVGHTGSTIGSMTGDIDLTAKKGQITVQGSTIDTKQGDINALAQNIRVIDTQNTDKQDSFSKSKSIGITVSLSNAVLDTAQSISNVYQQSQQAQGGTQTGAVAASGAFAAYNAYRTIGSQLSSAPANAKERWSEKTEHKL